MEISVIVPVYNTGCYLRACVQSLLSQTILEKMEIILVDDGSTDDSPHLVEEFAENQTCIRAVHQKNQGVSAARNLGMQLARGNYIGFVDSDDTVSTDMYEILLKDAQESGADISAVGYFVRSPSGRTDSFWDSGKKYHWNREEAVRNYLEEKTTYRVCDKLFKRNICEGIAFYDGKTIGEDKFFLFETLCRCKLFVFDDRCKYYYYTRPNSAITAAFSEAELDTLFFLDKVQTTVMAQFPNMKASLDYHTFRVKYGVLRRMSLSPGLDSRYFPLRQHLISDLKQMEYAPIKKRLSVKRRIAWFLYQYFPNVHSELIKRFEL